MKMRELMRITFVCVCAFLLAVRETRCEDEVPEVEDAAALRGEDLNEQRKDPKAPLPAAGRRTTTQSSANATRDSQLLSLLAARRRQLLNERLATHINTLASLAHKANKTNTTFLQLEVRDSTSSTVKRITFDNSSNDPETTLKLVTSDGSKEIKQDVKPHEIRHLFIPRLYQENKSRAGFINNRRREAINRAVTSPERVEITESSIVYVPPEKFENLDKDVELDPEEEFQVDESNHGLYLLNYSDTENVTQNTNITTTVSEATENTTIFESTTVTSDILKEETTLKPVNKDSEEKTESNTIANSTESRNTKLVKVENDKDNQTLFMTDEIYNHFRPMETELPVEEIAPFKFFGQKLGGPAISDNLTNSPSLSASTKSVNFIVAPSEKRKFNSRYSATEKYKNTSVDEEEINEDMDVSVVKKYIEKNKIRNTVKGPAPARHVGLVNAYRKYSSTVSPTTTTTTQSNVTEVALENSTQSTVDQTKDASKTNGTTISKDTVPKRNNTLTTRENISTKLNVTSAAPRNFTRNYSNIRRRPLRVTAAVSTENTPVLSTLPTNATTEKASTSVYTAVVTSVSITSSMKGQNKTDASLKDDNSTVPVSPETNVTSTPKAIILNATNPTTVSPSIYRPKHIIRIRTTTTENPNFSPYTVSSPPNEPTTKVSAALVKNETESKISERLASLFRQRNIENSTNSTRSRNHRRRRPTTTTSTTTTPGPTLPPSERATELPVSSPLPTTASSTVLTTTLAPDTTPAFKPFVVTSRTSSKSSSKPVIVASTTAKSVAGKNVNRTNGEEPGDIATQNEEVVIEAEKTYTASYVLAGLGFLPVAAIVAFVLRSVLNKKTKEIDTEYEGYFEDGDIKKESPITPVARPPLPTPTKPDQKWEFPRNKLRLQTLLGQGNFGQVWKAEADDLNGHDGLTRLVAVKSIKETASQKEKQELLHEIYIMQKIGTHPNVVTLLACCTEQEPYLLIMEYVMCGKLLTYLRERRSRPDRFSGSGALTSRDLTVFAYCVARGMDYIASKGIVHRDLAARNVLVDHNKLCKVADFGMSRAGGTGGATGGPGGATAGARGPRGALPVRWMAPEALLYNVHSTHTDVWAFGILLWEIVTLGSTPYAAMSGREVLAAVTEGYRLERPAHCSPALYRAMHACWAADPAQRPSFAALKAQLAHLLDNEPAEGNYVDLDSFYQESSVYSDPSAIINDDEGLSAEYDRERRCFRELATGPAKFENRAFNFRDEELRNKFGIGTPRMGGFGIRDVPFNDRNFSDGEFNERNFPKENFSDTNFTERKDGKLSTSSFHRERERERENPLVSRNSFNGFPRVGNRDRDSHFQMAPDGRNKRVPEFECDI